ncbi:MATE family efflux transporter [Pseudobacteriovorax antillogorgiicola]|uniref:Multidrug-efflux transporter n=1 Tax=Pseudobacteriovorax antillogorgiicola TaxID=1513793 RepID=A0A1Y6BDZ4_9BACT|nr:MATE family efflux transporter [Pseudobacteriovorax antillogorgiicola]TCS58624.1 MATE family multidrug resistance protein [Pseudobacteriovorax antillogorgiicola]SME96688.1 multidrug resistance protein, MATE family [Pseudobacteriovorax antillogorgiicola]
MFPGIYEFRRLIMLAVPVILSQVGNISMGLVDTYVVGKVSAEDLAGVAAGNSLVWPLLIVAIGLLLGIDTIVSQSFSRRDFKTIYQCLGFSFLLSLTLSLLLIPVILLAADYFYLTGATPAVVEKAVPYIKVVAFSTPFLVMFNCLQKFWQAMEIATPVTIIIVVANILNYVLDEAFVLGRWGFPALGSEGVAYATLIGRVFMFLAILGLSFYLWSKQKPAFRPTLATLLGFDKVLAKLFLKLSIPAASQIGLEVAAFNVMTLIGATLGAKPLAAHHIVLNIATTTFMFPMGLSMATSIRVGNHCGLQQYQKASQVGFLGISLGAIVMALFGLILFLFPETLIGLFTEDSEVVSMALTVIGLCALFQVVDGIQVVSGGALRGSGDTKTSLYANLAGFYFIGFPVSILACFTFNQGLWGLWLGLATGLLLVSIFNTLMWYKRVKRLQES